MIRPELNKIKNNKFKRKREIVNTVPFYENIQGWLSERYSTTTVHKYWGPQLSGNFSIVPPSAIGLWNGKC